jgi:hypothetical protein
MEDKITNPSEAVRSSEKKSINPDFINNVKGGKKEEAAKNLNEFENSAGSSSSESSRESWGGPLLGGYYRGSGKESESGNASKGKSKGKISKKAPLIIGIGLVLLVPAAIILLKNPLTIIGALDYNMMDSLNYIGTAAAMENLALRILQEKTSEGRIPSKIANDLAEHGYIFGQVTESGDFVRTNTYIADIDKNMEIAATGFDYHQYGSEGKLSVLYNGEIIKAEDLVLAVESDPEKYKNYIDAIKVKAEYFINAAQEVYEKLGLSLTNFYDWETTGNEEEDKKAYNKIINEILKDDISAAFAGCGESVDDCAEAELEGSSEGIVSRAIDAGGSNDKSSQLLNMAISSTEPLRAARAFLAIEEPIQRARLDGTGPVNQVMDTLNRQTEFKYIDVNTNEPVTVKKSILETKNFAAAASGGVYSVSEANNFSRDRVLVATGTESSNEIGTVIKESILRDNNKTSPLAMLKKAFGFGVDRDTIEKAEDSVRVATMEFNSDNFTSILGGNRAVAGGSYIIGAINQQLIGTMPADSETVMASQQEVDKVLALRANAEQVNLSPFDTSSPNTFLGNITHRISSAYLNHSSRGNSSLVTMFGSLANLTSDSASSLLGDAIADGSDRKFTTLGGACTTASQAYNSMGDIYCNELRPLVLDYKDKTMSWWQETLGGEIDSNGKPIKGSEFAEFIDNATNREAPVGVQSETICAGDEPSSQFFGLGSLLSLLIGGCKADSDVVTGAKYTLSGSNDYSSKVKKYVGYMMYDRANSMVENVKSEVSKYREEYYKEHPLDNSPAGRIARMSGMTKDEAKLALSYASYLARIRNYNPLERYAFGGPYLRIDNQPLIIDDAEIKEMVYCYWRGKSEYFDLRNKSHVA